MHTIAAVVFLVTVTIIGDYFLKLGSMQAHPFRSAATHTGAMMYLVTGYGWTLVMQRTNLTVVGASYAALTIIGLTALSLLVFREEVSARQLIGAGLAFAAVCLLIEVPEARSAGSS